ncbi:unnamed protein product [Durusdinium trenchii]|uniref:THIF-type NAD/FAD binding fold domain-containing protein n=2 Tax=Durusdinium trenchii TaxID=1381693 RepID=A0ABP0HSG6_9DINO
MAEAAHTELTTTRYRGFVRKDEEWPEDSEQYKAGCDIENRKRPPPDEVPGDVFDRQRVIPGFDQGLMERQDCLVLGAGGIGQNVALTLARLGVRRITLVDNDLYVASNLTRQCLGSIRDVGKRKVDVAKAGLESSHNLRSEIVAVHCDAILEWGTVVELARQSTVVFNAIDSGVMWDFCVNSLCKELGLPLCAGQSFGWKFMTELYTGKVDEVCAFCYDSVSSTFATNEKAITRPGGVLDRLQVSCAGSCAGVEEVRRFLTSDRQFRCHEGQLLNEILAGALQSVGGQLMLEWSKVLQFLQAFQQDMVTRLLPGQISKLHSLGFIPQPKHAETRFVGSWVCPCLSCAVTMVSQWSGLLTAPQVEEGVPETLMPQSITFNLDAGMTGEEQLGYELGVLGMTLDRQERRFCRDASAGSCRVCAAARRRRTEEALFVGAKEVALAPVQGEVYQLPQSWSCSSDLSELLARRSHPTVAVPALPAWDWRPENLVPSRKPTEEWPLELWTMPLMKVPQRSSSSTAPSALRGLASGVRSALVKVKGQWFRLKGCGNRDEGFPMAKVGNKGEASIRGSCFKHTAYTEVRMNDLVAEVLQKAGLDCANQSLGCYWYRPEPSWPLPEIDRYCGVFQTSGNARLGDHLIGGILALLPHVLEPMEKELTQCILRGRGSDESELLETCDLVSCALPTADCVDVALDGRQPPSSSELEPAVPQAFQGLWDDLREKVEASSLLWLAWRLGWECGETLRALHDAEISWGTYADSMGIHCNAHINNFVVKGPCGLSGGAKTFLAALDFDMAFTRQNFVPEALSQSSFLDSFDAILAFEESMGMKMVLAGSDFASTGVANAKAPESHRLMEMALRDTMVAAYTAALEKQTDPHPLTEERQRVSYDLIKLALCLTTHVEG